MRSSHHLVDPIGALLEEVAKSEIMPRFLGLVHNSVSQKTSAFDVVSEVDEAAEKIITERLSCQFPKAVIVGEEAATRDPTIINAVRTEELVFLVDPIDGTKNFVSGVPLFGIMVACVAKGDVVFGAIHDPVCESTAFAIRGEGAWIARKGGGKQDLRVSAVINPREMHAVAGANFMPDPIRKTFLDNSMKLALSFWMRCCAHEYRMAAGGACDLLIYNKLSPWDHAAGWLLHREAGGYSAHLDGRPYRVGDLDGGLMCAPSRDAWLAAQQMLFGEA